MAINNIVWNLDCKDLLRTGERRSLLVADPPYGENGNSHRRNKTRSKITMSTNYHNALWAQPKPDDEYFKLAFECSENQIIFGANYFPQLCEVHKTPRLEQLEEWLANHGTGWIVWDKVNGNNTFNDFELAWTSFKVPTQIFRFMWSGMMQGKSISEGTTMQGNKNNNERRIHPTQKPVLLYQWVFHHYARPGDTIIDTHVGSGSSRIAADKMGFDFRGTEIDETHFNDQEKRYALYKSQQTFEFA